MNCQSLLSEKNISKCHVLNFLPSMQSAKAYTVHEPAHVKRVLRVFRFLNSSNTHAQSPMGYRYALFEASTMSVLYGCEQQRLLRDCAYAYVGAGSSEPLLVAFVISTLFPCADTYKAKRPRWLS